MTDRERLIAGLETSPWDSFAIIADACEEEGKIWEARAWRWLAQKRKFPRTGLRQGVEVHCWESRYGIHWGWTVRLPCLEKHRNRKTLSLAFLYAAQQMAAHFEHQAMLEGTGFTWPAPWLDHLEN